MGRFRPDVNLAETARQVTLSSLRDPRFRDRPIIADELDGLSIEISILSNPTRAPGPDAVEAGVHGILVRRGGAEGCFLPQVATEQRWDREELLSRCCALKAGLAPDAWKDPDTEIHVFTADILEDE
jgi:uncharacterized protein (TIGR00296 family)